MARKPKTARSSEGRAASHFKRAGKLSASAKSSERLAAGASSIAGVATMVARAVPHPATKVVGAAVGAGAGSLAGVAVKQAGKDRADAARARRQGAASVIASTARKAKAKGNGPGLVKAPVEVTRGGTTFTQMRMVRKD